MGYTDLSAEFDYKDLLTWQLLDALGENDAYFKGGAVTVTGAWTMSSTLAVADNITISTNAKDLIGKTTAAASKGLIGLNANDKINIGKDGLNVGIEVANPTEKLEVNGNVKCTDIVTTDYGSLSDFSMFCW